MCFAYAIVLTAIFASIPRVSPEGQAQATTGPSLPEVRKVIAEGNVQWGKARVAYDRQTMEQMLAPDFYVQLRTRRLTRQEFIDQVSVAAGPVKLVRFDATVLTVMPDGGGWAAVIQEKLEFERRVPDGTTERAYALWITRDGWKQVDGSWKVGYSEEIGNEMWRGGVKPPFKDW